MRRIRTRLGLTQEKFAELVGIAPNSVARQERGELGIKESLARLIRLIAAKGISGPAHPQRSRRKAADLGKDSRGFAGSVRSPRPRRPRKNPLSK